ncbi:hypothetical protein ERO13_D04G017400v2 [Gossypium hirsutum]|uniref:Uncharacterized protein isoform X2 n=1 Tax=Gossypium hirsutum TaxID=3635 RepID=A0ABM2ZY70_GOSHI|nr:uncharacterized protein LOC107927588 isoform X2 [Gossypium hirsutum]KAG4150655.1 hypothetical protein ERO13_D04G017400v2 [Gossypium hirsutum]
MGRFPFPDFFVRITCNMEDSHMTIEFLRARLLSERSVSKSARQRADELARRVAELEEHLRIVSVQRRRAEKATADVLAILENNGVSDVSEELDSSSDQDTPFESNMDNVSTKEEESSVSSKARRKESEELSGSDDFSSVSGRSLSWKGRKGASHSPEKYKDSLARRRNSFTSMAFSSPKQRQGKSCRQIRRRESRLVAEEHKSDDVKVDPPVNGLVNSLEVNTNHSESEKDMEKALEHQAQLIDRYEAMERAQREWEEKFRENNSSTPDSCDPGNNSDVTEERGSSQVQEAEGEHICFSKELPKTQSHDPVPPSHDEMDQLQERNCSSSFSPASLDPPSSGQKFVSPMAKVCICCSKELPKTQSHDPVPPSHVEMDQLRDRNCSSSLSPASLDPTSSGQKFVSPIAKENHDQESLQSNHSPLPSSHQFAHAHDSPGKQAVQHYSSDMSSSSIMEPSGNKNELYALVPHEAPGKFTNVLDALKQARMSLQQKIHTLPLIEGASGGKAIEPSVHGRQIGERVEIPVGCSGLFRVPTDFSAEASKVNFRGSGLQLSLANYYPEAVVVPTSSSHLLTTSYMNTQSSSSSNYSDRFYSNPYMDVRSSYSAVPTASGYISDDQNFTGRYAETGSRSTQKPRFDPYMEPGLPSSGLQSYPTFPTYPDLVPQMQTKEAFPVFRAPSSGQVRPDQFSFYDNHFRPDTHRF